MLARTNLVNAKSPKSNLHLHLGGNQAEEVGDGIFLAVALL
jgi:hypothetical protein